jgi:hypothetical protein
MVRNKKLIFFKALKEIFKAKEDYHKKLAKLSMEKKIKILVCLQQIAVDINPFLGKTRKNMVWAIR